MRIAQRFETVYQLKCTCGVLLELDEADFEDYIYEMGPNKFTLNRVKTPCPNCGRLWDNVGKNDSFIKKVNKPIN